MLTPTEQEELRARFNPDGSLLRQHQLKMLEMLKYIDSVCKKHNIKYWLCSGTLLGAVRHGGFIPWDDDVDIEMLRDDYKKLIRILHAEKNESYVIQTYKNDMCYVSPYAKLRELYSDIEDGCEDFKYRGRFIDIFAMERNTHFIQCLTIFLQEKILYPLAYTKIFPKKLKICYLSILKILFFYIIYPLCRLYNRCFAEKDKLYHACGVGFKKKRKVVNVFPLKELVFEGYPFYVPGNYDAYLRDVYGADYMSVPAADKIKTHNVKFKSLK